MKAHTCNFENTKLMLEFLAFFNFACDAICVHNSASMWFMPSLMTSEVSASPNNLMTKATELPLPVKKKLKRVSHAVHSAEVGFESC